MENGRREHVKESARGAEVVSNATRCALLRDVDIRDLMDVVDVMDIGNIVDVRDVLSTQSYSYCKNRFAPKRNRSRKRGNEPKLTRLRPRNLEFCETKPTSPLFAMHSNRSPAQNRLEVLKEALGQGGK